MKYGNHSSGSSSTLIKTKTSISRESLRSSWSWLKVKLKWYIVIPVLALICRLIYTTESVILQRLDEVELNILKYIKSPHRDLLVDIGPLANTSGELSETLKIRTVIFNEDSENVPLVMIHGLCAAVGLWALNIDPLASNRPVFAIDVLGFGRSSRPDFSSIADEAEAQHVEALEAWRKAIKLEKFVLLGHSMGGYLATSYALKYPHRVIHLIAADPWGFPKKPADVFEHYQVKHPLLVKSFFAIAKWVNPLAVLRLLGPIGPKAIETFRPDLVRRFHPIIENGGSVAEYIYYANALSPTGEGAMRVLMDNVAWAENPIVNRLHLLPHSVPMSIIYGGRSWMRQVPEKILRQIRTPESSLRIHTLPGAGHHVYADDTANFHRIINQVGEEADSILKRK